MREAQGIFIQAMMASERPLRIWGVYRMSGDEACGALRACFENRSGEGLRARRAGWRGATKENIPRGSSTKEQRRQPARPAARPTEIFSKHALTEAHGQAAIQPPG